MNLTLWVIAGLLAAVFAAASRPVRHVMAGGEWVVRDFAHRNEAVIDAAYAVALKALAA